MADFWRLASILLDACAVALTAGIAMTRAHQGEKKHRGRYAALTLCVALFFLCDGTVRLVEGQIQYKVVLETAYFFLLLSGFCSLAAFGWYAAALIDKKTEALRRNLQLILLICAFGALWVLLSFSSGMLCEVDGAGYLLRGGFVWLFPWLIATSLALTAAMVLTHRTHIDRPRAVSLSVSAALPILPVLLHGYVRDFSVISLSALASLLILQLFETSRVRGRAQIESQF